MFMVGVLVGSAARCAAVGWLLFVFELIYLVCIGGIECLVVYNSSTALVFPVQLLHLKFMFETIL